MNNITEDFLYKIIHINGYDTIIEELSKYAYNNLPNKAGRSNPYWHLHLFDLLKECPSIDAWFKEKQIVPRVCAIIVVTGDGANLIHVDHQKNKLALNFGIEIPPESYTGMYKLTKGKMHESMQPNGIPNYIFFNDAEFDLIDKFDLHQPTLFNTKVPHGVYSPIGLRRISLTFRFIEDPWRLLDDNN
jgi:hypothetical protein